MRLGLRNLPTAPKDHSAQNNLNTPNTIYMPKAHPSVASAPRYYRSGRWTGALAGLERSLDWSGRWTGAVARLERSLDWSGRWTGAVAGLERSLDWSGRWTRAIIRC